jgi:hypothetical protein
LDVDIGISRIGCLFAASARRPSASDLPHDTRRQGQRNIKPAQYIKLMPGTLPIKRRVLFGIEAVAVESPHLRQQYR